MCIRDRVDPARRSRARVDDAGDGDAGDALGVGRDGRRRRVDRAASTILGASRRFQEGIENGDERGERGGERVVEDGRRRVDQGGKSL